jgi:hypothetical protein
MALAMTRGQQDMVRKLFHTVAHSNYVSLGLQVTSLKSNWAALRAVHPFRLLLEVFNDPTMVADLTLIYRDSWKKDRFLTDFAYTLKHGTANYQELAPYMASFSAQAGIRVETLEDTLAIQRTRKWEDIIEILYNKKCIIATPASAR